MRAPLSIVIPTLNAEPVLPGCLAALMAGVAAGLVRELVVCDSGSQDATRAIAEAAGAVWIGGADGPGGPLARGIAASNGAWLLMLAADTRLAPGWVEAVERGMARGGPGYFPLRSRARGLAPRIAGAMTNLRARGLGRTVAGQGLLVTRADAEAALGNVAPARIEDLARRLAHLRPLEARALTG